MSVPAPALTLSLLGSSIEYEEYVRLHGEPGRDFFAQLSELLAREARADPAGSTPRAARLLALAKAAGRAEYLAFAQRAAGNVAFLRGDYPQAVDHYRTALEGFAGDEVERGRTLSSLLHPLAMLGDNAGSMAAAAEARTCFERCGDRHRLARLDVNLASVWFRQDRFAEALASLDQAQQGLEASEAGRADHEAGAAVRVTRAVVLINLARFEEAEAAYAEAHRYALAHELPALAAQADYNLGYLQFLRGQYVHAMRGLNRARQTAARYGDKLHLALCDLDQADVCIELNLHEDALQLARTALAQFEALGMPYEQGKALTDMALAEQSLGRDSAALERLAEAESAFASASNEFWVHMADLYRAVILLHLGRCFEAMQLSERARIFFAARQARTKTIYAGIIAARAHAAAMDLPGAQAAAARAAADLAGLEAPWLQVQVHLLLGHLAERGGRRAEALAAYEEAMRQAEATRGNLNFDELRISFMRDKTQLYERYFDVLLESDPPAEAVWRHMERSKSRSLAQLIAGGMGTIVPRAGGGSRVVGEIKRLREELSWYYRQLDTGRASSPGDAVEGVLQAIRQREGDLQRAILQLPEDYRVLEQESAITLERLREHLEGASWVEYFHCANGFVAAVGDRHDLRVVRLPGERNAIESAMRLLRFQVGKRAMEGEHFRRHADAFQHAADSHLRLLHRELIAPLRPYLREERLLIVPHGVLHSLPFGALHAGERALLDEFALAVAPSAAVFALCQQRPASRNGGVLVVAAEPEAARDEIRAVGQCWPEVTALEGGASNLAAVRRAAEASRLIHIAAHGVFRADNPYFSALELADGPLNVIDIYNLRLHADLVVLSGCGTALGGLGGGDEVIGLTRAFLYAGARSVIASLWDVDDRTTAAFMQRFYALWSQGQPAAEALREAQREFRTVYGHPFFWAPFQLIGSFA